MSFQFQWPTFSKEFQADAAQMLDSALNKSPRPKVIADDIRVEDINMGTIPPELEILEIGELSTDRFRGIFRLTYAGDAHLILSTKVQANPLSRPAPSSSAFGFEDTSSVFPTSMPSRGILFAARPLVVPMQLRLSAVRLKAIVVLVVSKQKGITLVFKNDPLDSVDVSSTFDSVAVIQKYLQQEIEGQLREMFREDLPGIIHRLSQRWLSGGKESGKSGNGSSTRGNGHRSSSMAVSSSLGHMSSPPRTNTSGIHITSSPPERRNQRPIHARSSSGSQFASSSTTRSPSRRRKAEKVTANASTPSSPRMTHRGSTVISASPRGTKIKAPNTTDSPIAKGTRQGSESDLPSSFGLGGTWSNGLVEEMDRYDPTYGLRPDEVRMSIHGSGYSGLARLANQVNGGLRDLATAREEEESHMNDVNPNVELSEDVFTSEEEGEVISDEDDQRLSIEEEMMRNLDMSEDDVPDHPPSDEQDEQDISQGEQDESSLYDYSPLKAAFSDTAMEDSIRRSNSVFGFDSPQNSSPKVSQRSNRSQSHHSKSRPASIVSSNSRACKSKKVEYETIPAVGGGIITRPRIYHTASRVQAPDVEEQDVLGEELVGGSAAASSTARGPSSSRTQTVRPARSYREEFDQRSQLSESEGEEGRYSIEDSPSAVGDGSLATLEPEPMDPTSSTYRTQLYRQHYGRLYRAGYGRHSSMSSGEVSNRGQSMTPAGSGDRSTWSTSRSSTAPTSTHPSTQADFSTGNRRSLPSSPSNREIAKVRGSPVNNSSPFKQSNLTNSQSMTLGASHHFMDLVNSNHTLSPFTRTLDTKGFAVRSHPVTPSTGSGGETSSSVGAMASRQISAASSLSQQWREGGGGREGASGGYFEKHKPTTSESGGVRKRTFKLGGGSQSEMKTVGTKAKRPDSTPLQQGRMSSDGPVRGDRARSFTSMDFESATSPQILTSKSSQGKSIDVRRRSRPFAQSERAINTMGAIRE